METAARRKVDSNFDIHVDAAMTDDRQRGSRDIDPHCMEEVESGDEHIEDLDPHCMEETENDEEEEDEEDDDSSDDDNVESSVQEDMDRLQRDFPGFRDKYRLIKRIGEGKVF